MRSRLQDIIRGTQSEKTTVLFEKETVRFRVVENSVFSGRFSFSFADGKNHPGIVTCPDEHIHIMNARFDAPQGKIRFEYKAGELLSGTQHTGHFVITCNAGEFLLPYEVTISGDYAHTSIGWIKTLNDFTNLAKLNWEEAVRLFGTKQFLSVFSEKDDHLRALYEALSSRGISSHIMEEFLIGAGKKQRNCFFLDEQKQTFVLSDRIASDEICIRKTAWGYIHLKLVCDAPFVKLEKQEVGPEDFRGNRCVINYSVNPRKLHGGKNFAHIRIWDMYHTEVTQVLAFSDRFKNRQTIRHPHLLCRAQLMRLYLEKETGKINDIAWIADSLKHMESYLRKISSQDWAVLLYVYFLNLSGQETKAQEYLRPFAKRAGIKNTPEEAFYLYLKAELSDDAADKNVSVAKVRELYRKYPYDPVSAYVLLQMDDVLIKNDERRYTFLKKQLTASYASPLFYCEACRLILKNPSLVQSADVYEFRLLYWIHRHGLFTKMLIEPAVVLSKVKTRYDTRYIDLLTDCYALHPSDEVLKTLCTYLISFRKYNREHFPWYALAVGKGLRIAGLFEAYIRTWEPDDGMIPREILKYFTIQNSLAWPWKARLYAYILQHREILKTDWEPYETLIRNFAVKCLKNHYANDDLFLLYQYLKDTLPADEWNHLRQYCENIVRVTATDEFFVNVCCYDRKKMQMIVIPLHERQTFLYRNDDKEPILLQDKYSKLYTSADTCRIEPMMEKDPARILEEENAVILQKSEEDTRRLADSLERFDDCIDALSEKIRRAKEAGIHVQPWQEQLLLRMLFTGHFSEDHEELFSQVAAANGDTQILDAYAAHAARAYLADDVPLCADVVGYLIRNAKGGRFVNAYCKVALLKYQYTAFAMRPLKPQEAQELLEPLMTGHDYFGFMNQLPFALKRRYLTGELYFVQFAYDSGKHLTIHIRKQKASGSLLDVKEENITQVLFEPLPGIYVLPVYVSPGSSLSYEIYHDGKILKTDLIDLEDSFFENPLVSYARSSRLYGERGTPLPGVFEKVRFLLSETFADVDDPVIQRSGKGEDR